MYSIEVIIAVIIAIVLRVIIQRGSFTLPTVYKEGSDVRFNFGTLGVVVVAIAAFFAGGYIDPNITMSPLSAFMLAYATPAVIDGAVTQALPGTDEITQQ